MVDNDSSSMHKHKYYSRARPACEQRRSSMEIMHAQGFPTVNTTLKLYEKKSFYVSASW